MGLFHCPMGAAFYDDEACIDCGLCSATTKEEMVKASGKLRDYLRSHAARKGAIKKIAVAGKGGVGKSTIVTLMANTLKKDGYSVLVLDADESNPGLYRMFGFKKQPRPLMSLLSRFSPGEPEPDAAWLKHDQITSQDIPPEYVLESRGLRFLMVGKIADPFQGCACSMAGITRDLMARLVVKDKEMVLVDMEAGIESFGRGVERYVDVVLIVVEPSFESMALAEKVGYMAEGMGIGRVMAILNKVPSEKIRQRMVDELDKRGIRIIGTVYLDRHLSEAGFEGRALGNSRAAGDMKGIINLLLNESGLPPPTPPRPA
jgi:CO dehydrogenase maturation factor